MFSLMFKLMQIFGDVPWLARYLKLGVNSNLMSGIETIVTGLAKTKDVGIALQKIKSDKELEMEFQRALLIAENEYWQMCLQDRQDARERDLALQKLKGKNRRANIMLFLAIIGILSSLGVLIAFKAFLTSDVIGIISAIAAVFGSCLKDAYSFEFGSGKKGSEMMKNEKLHLAMWHTISEDEIIERIKEIQEILSKDVQN